MYIASFWRHFGREMVDALNAATGASQEPMAWYGHIQSLLLLVCLSHLLASKAMDDNRLPNEANSCLARRFAMAAANFKCAIEGSKFACRDPRWKHCHDGSKPHHVREAFLAYTQGSKPSGGGGRSKSLSLIGCGVDWIGLEPDRVGTKFGQIELDWIGLVWSASDCSCF